MTVQELIDALQPLPRDVQVWHVWDGEPRTIIEHVYLTHSGIVATIDNDEVVYNEAGRPLDVPLDQNTRYWVSPGRKERYGDYYIDEPIIGEKESSYEPHDD